MKIQTDPIRCAHCREPIASEARRCPHCCANLGWSHLNPWGLTALFVSAMLALSVLFYHLSLSPGPAFSDHAVDLVIVESSFAYSYLDGADFAWIGTVGTIRNTGPIGWRHPQLEVVYFNAEKARVDSVTNTPYELKILPGQEVTFRVLGKAARPDDEYAFHTVAIRNAEATRER